MVQYPHCTTRIAPVTCTPVLQAMYQRFDQGFVGLICSVFNANSASKEQTVQLTAFQAVQGAPEQPLLGVSSSELGGLDDDMKAALAASAAGS